MEVSAAPVMEQRRFVRFRDRSEVSLAIKYLIFAFNILIWVNFCCILLYCIGSASGMLTNFS